MVSEETVADSFYNKSRIHQPVGDAKDPNMEQTDQLLGKSKTMGIFEQLAEIKHQEGIQEGLEKAIRGLLVYNKLSMSEIAEAAGVPVDLVVKIKKGDERKMIARIF
jgi:hypothetical protein